MLSSGRLLQLIHPLFQGHAEYFQFGAVTRNLAVSFPIRVVQWYVTLGCILELLDCRTCICLASNRLFSFSNMTVPICTPPRDSSVALPVFTVATVFNRGCAGKQVVKFTVSFCLFLADGHWHVFPSVYWPFGNTYFSIMLLHVLVLSNRLLYVLAMGVWLITYVCISLTLCLTLYLLMSRKSQV